MYDNSRGVAQSILMCSKIKCFWFLPLNVLLKKIYVLEILIGLVLYIDGLP